jgi:hypothetical protein
VVKIERVTTNGSDMNLNQLRGMAHCTDPANLRETSHVYSKIKVSLTTCFATTTTAWSCSGLVEKSKMNDRQADEGAVFKYVPLPDKRYIRVAVIQPTLSGQSLKMTLRHGLLDLAEQ